MFRSTVLSRFSRSAVATLLASAVLATVAVQPTSAAQLPGDPSIAAAFAAEQALLDLTNADRLANGLSPLDVDMDTLVIARERAASQLGTPALSHYDDRGELAFVNLLARSRVNYQLAGENLARSNSSDAGVTSRIEQALMNSPAHRKNILEQGYSKVAIGVATDGKGQIAFAEVYRN